MSEIKFLELNPLSNPKGTSKLCELCDKPAYRVCKKCRVTFYCDGEHQATDFHGIHKVICSSLMALRTKKPPTSVDKDAKEQMKKERSKILQISQQLAYKFLFEGQFGLAIPAALQFLKASKQLSENPIDLLPAYLILGEASIGLLKYHQAEDYLCQAKWAILKAGSKCDDLLIAKVHRNFGQLYLAQEDYEKALNECALAVYHTTLVSDPEDISLTGPYYQLGLIFERQGKMLECTSFYEKIISIWTLKWNPQLVLGYFKINKVDVAHSAECIQTVSFIVNFLERANLQSHRDAMFVLAKVYYSSGNFEKSREFALKALTGQILLTLEFELSLGMQHSTTIEVNSFLKSCPGLRQ